METDPERHPSLLGKDYQSQERRTTAGSLLKVTLSAVIPAKAGIHFPAMSLFGGVSG